MELRPQARAVVLTIAIFSLGATEGFSVQLQVPSLPSQPAGYIQYAITNLPNHYKAPPVASTNNTPLNNPITDAGATLGRVLFYDKRLSHNDGVACASCHKQANGFSDPNQFSQGVAGQTGRHSMGLSNSAYYANGKAFWDQRANSLEDQALVPIQNEVEMGSTLPEVVAKLNQTTFYPTLFQAAFQSPEITPERIGKAISQFERSMVSYNSAFDNALKGIQPLSPQAQAGSNLFHSAAGRCSACHTTDATVSNGIHNIGLDDPSTDTDIDTGAGNGQFKAPSLRNVAVRGKFMHDGRFSSLVEVLQFYSGGIKNNPNLDPILQTPQHTPVRLGFNGQEINQLVAYLNSLTDSTFLASSLFSNPFVTLPGDYTGDGMVDAADYSLWRDNVGDTTSLAADGNSDGVVDAGDYAVWLANFGRNWLSLTSGSALESMSQSVPEPAGFTLALLAICWAARLRSRARPRSGSTGFS